MAAIAAGSIVRVSSGGRALRVGATLHFGVHMASFALLTLLAAGCTASPRTRGLLFFAVWIFCYGTEFYEHLGDGFPVERPDVLADSLGFCAGVILWIVVRQFAAPRWKSASR